MAQAVIKEGRCLIIVVNKWDLVPADYKTKIVKFLNHQLQKKMGVVKQIPLLFVSAQSGNNVKNIMENVLTLYEKWNERISTGTLNDWLKRIQKFENIPNDGQTRLKMRFISQIKTRPPTFAVFVNDKDLARENFEKFMSTTISNEFGFSGVPVRFVFRDSNYLKTKKRVEQKDADKPLRTQFIRQRKIPGYIKQRLLNLKAKIKGEKKK